jgi:hypothetical protein
MRKTIATVVVLSPILIGYTAWPLYDLFVLVRAIETRDVGTVTRHVHFDRVLLAVLGASRRIEQGRWRATIGWRRRHEFSIDLEALGFVTRHGVEPSAFPHDWTMPPSRRIGRCAPKIIST